MAASRLLACGLARAVMLVIAAYAVIAGPAMAQQISAEAQLGRLGPPTIEAVEPPEKPIGAELGLLEPVVLAAPAPQFPDFVRLELASWSLTDGNHTASPSTSEERTTTWRTSFGSERTSWRKLRRGPAGFQADVIALQGVSSLQDVRRSFPARDYHAIVSRQLLTRSSATSTGLSVIRSSAPPTTALVYRRQRGVRIAGVRHFLPSSNATLEPPAITVFRLRFYNKLVWFASLDLSPNCSAEVSAKCTAESDLTDRFLVWAKRVARQRAPIVLLGRWSWHVATGLREAGFAPETAQVTSTTCVIAMSLLVAQAEDGPTFAAVKPEQSTAAAPVTNCLAKAKAEIDLR